MFLRSFGMKYVFGVLLVALSLSAPRKFDFYSEEKGFISEDDQRNWLNMYSLCVGRFVGLRAEKDIASKEPDFAAFLTSIFSDPVIIGLMNERVEIDYSAPLDEIKARRADKIEWLKALNAALAGRGFLADAADFDREGYMPSPQQTIIFPSSEEFRKGGYVATFLCTNTYRLGYYDAEGRDAQAWGSRPSRYPFPLQMISKILYEDQMNKLLSEIDFGGSHPVRIARNYLFALPGTEGLPLDDWNVLLVQEGFAVPDNQSAHAARFITKPFLGSILNFLRCARAFSIENPTHFFFRSHGDQVVVRNFERPAFGGSHAYDFMKPGWEHSLQAQSNTGVGLVTLMESIFKLLALPEDRIEGVYGLPGYADCSDDEGASAPRSRRG